MVMVAKGFLLANSAREPCQTRDRFARFRDGTPERPDCDPFSGTRHNGGYMSTLLLDAADMRRTLGRMAHEILESNQGAENLVVVGIVRRGWPVAKRLAFSMSQIEGTQIPCGKLSIAQRRDDRPSIESDETEIPFEVTGKVVILVDEVVFTGRSARAALDALFAYGRPSAVRLAALIDRGHRELPIQPDYCGRVLATERGDHIRVNFAEFDGEDSVVLSPAPQEVA